MYPVHRRGEGAVKLSWMKGHKGIVGNEEADERAGLCTNRTRERSVTGGGIRAFWKQARRVEKEYTGFSMGRAMEWGRRALTNYTHTRTRKAKIGYWRELVGQADSDCRRCEANMEDGDDVAFHCGGMAEGRRWTS